MLINGNCMDKKRKILFIIGIALIIVLGIIAIVIGKSNSDNIQDFQDESENTPSEDVLKDIKIADVTITNQSIITREGMSTYMANIVNESDDVNHIDELYAVFTLNGESMTTLVINNTSIKADDSLPVSIEFDRNLSEVTKIEYKIVDEEVVE